MLTLIYKDRNLLIKLSINSLYVISNIFLLSLILNILISIVINYLPFNIDINTPSFACCFIISRTIFGILLSLKLTIHTIKFFYVHRKDPKLLIEKIFLLLLFLMVISFFFQLFQFIFVVFIAFSEFELKIAHSTLDEESKVSDSPLGQAPNTEESKISDSSLNHHLEKKYPKIIRAKGSYIYTEDGRKIFDASSGAAVSCIGYGNPEVLLVVANKFFKGIHYAATAH